MKARVSVLLPTRNGEERVGAAIASVLSQTCRDLELIVVNDGSTDGTLALLTSLAKSESRLRVIPLSASVGLQRALNIALAEATGTLVARIDDDDLWIDARKLEMQVAMMGRWDSLQLIGTGCEMVDPATGSRFVRAQPTTDLDIRRTFLSWNPFVHSSVVFRRDDAVACGGYDETYRHSEDYDLWLRLGLRGNLVNLSETCVQYRISRSMSTFSRRRRAWWEQLQLIRRYHRLYPGAGRAIASSLGRLGLHILPVGHDVRTLLRAARRR